MKSTTFTNLLKTVSMLSKEVTLTLIKDGGVIIEGEVKGQPYKILFSTIIGN